MDVSKSAAPDEIHHRVLKDLAEVQLAIISVTSWRSGVVLEAWKRENIMPVPRKTIKTIMKNERINNEIIIVLLKGLIHSGHI